MLRVMKDWIAPLFDAKRSNVYTVVNNGQRRAISREFKKAGISLSKVTDVETFHRNV